MCEIILTDSQYGFIYAKNTSDTLFGLTRLLGVNKIKRLLTFMDLAKAFDTVNSYLLPVKHLPVTC